MLNFTYSLAPPSDKIANQTVCFLDFLDLLINFAEDRIFANHKDLEILQCKFTFFDVMLNFLVFSVCECLEATFNVVKRWYFIIWLLGLDVKLSAVFQTFCANILREIRGPLEDFLSKIQGDSHGNENIFSEPIPGRFSETTYDAEELRHSIRQ